MSGGALDPVRCPGCAHTEEQHDIAGCDFGWGPYATEPGCDCKRTREDVLREALAWADDD